MADREGVDVADGTSLAHQCLRPMIEQMRQASEAELYFPAFMVALAVPDICAAAGSDNGRATGSKYRAWLQEHLRYAAADAAEIYELRCSLLHQGRLRGAGRRVAFMEPNALNREIHHVTMEVDGREVAWCSVPKFVEEISWGALDWVTRFGATDRVERNMASFARRRP